MSIYIILFAGWLNENFYGFDFSILKFYHNLGEATNYNISYFFRAVTATAEHGYGMLILSFLMMVIPFVPAIKKRYPTQCKAIFMCGVISFFGIVLGSVGTNLTIKKSVARLRPYDTYDIYKEWWTLARGNIDHEYSFPSGHTTCTMAVMTSIFWCGNRKKSWTAFLFVILMGASRNYFMMHYPTDIIGGILVGGIAATISYFVWYNLVFNKGERKLLNKMF